jgi:hypothetical protein
LTNPKPARIPPQTPPAGGKSAEAGQIQNPRKIVCPAESALFPFHSLGFSAKWVLTFSNKHHHSTRFGKRQSSLVVCALTGFDQPITIIARRVSRAQPPAGWRSRGAKIQYLKIPQRGIFLSRAKLCVALRSRGASQFIFLLDKHILYDIINS